MGNFAEITGKFLANEAAIQVADEQELEGAFDSLIFDQAPGAWPSGSKSSNKMRVPPKNSRDDPRRNKSDGMVQQF